MVHSTERGTFKRIVHLFFIFYKSFYKRCKNKYFKTQLNISNA